MNTPNPNLDEQDEPRMGWQLHMEIQPSTDGRFFSVGIQLRMPDRVVPIKIHTASSCDMLYEKIQSELNNALRLTVNDITERIIKPGKKARRS